MSDTARVLFPIDSNSAVALLREVYRSHGRIACLVTPKRATPSVLSGAEAVRALKAGAVTLVGDPQQADIQIVAVGAYQAQEALKARERIAARGDVEACVTALLEPGLFREPRDAIERDFVASDEDATALFRPDAARLILTHTRPEPMLGLLRRLDGGPRRTRALGYVNRGGTLDLFGMLFANRCTWAHAVKASCGLLEVSPDAFLSKAELLAVDERGDPEVLRDHR
jgi:phosphoketolase